MSPPVTLLGLTGSAQLVCEGVASPWRLENKVLKLDSELHQRGGKKRTKLSIFLCKSYSGDMEDII